MLVNLTLSWLTLGITICSVFGILSESISAILRKGFGLSSPFTRSVGIVICLTSSIVKNYRYLDIFAI